MAAAGHLQCRAGRGRAAALSVQFAVPAPAEPVQAAVSDHPAHRGACTGCLRGRKDSFGRHRPGRAGTAPAVRALPACLRRRAGHPAFISGARRDPRRRVGHRVGPGDRSTGVGLLRVADVRRPGTAPRIKHGHSDSDSRDDPDGRAGDRGATAGKVWPSAGGVPGRVCDRRSRGAGFQRRGDPDPPGTEVLRPGSGQRRQRAVPVRPSQRRLVRPYQAVAESPGGIRPVRGDRSDHRRGRGRHRRHPAVVSSPGGRRHRGSPRSGAHGPRPPRRCRSRDSHCGGDHRHGRAARDLDDRSACADDDGGAPRAAPGIATGPAARGPRSHRREPAAALCALRDGGARHGLLPGLRGRQSGVLARVASGPPG